MTNAEAAQQLGCATGTIQSRLACARQRLRARLTRRGLTLSAGILSTDLMPPSVTAAVPASLVKATLETTGLAATAKVGAGIASLQATNLAKGVLQTMLWTKIKLALASAVAVSAVGITGSVIVGQTSGSAVTTSQTAPAAPAPEKKPATDVAASKAKEKTVFEMRDKPWSQVFEWLSDQTGLPVIGAQKVKGTLNFISPRSREGQPRKYTMPEIIDIVNEGLLTRPNDDQYVLIRRQRSFLLNPASAEIPAAMVDLISVKDLDKHGQTEIVSIVLALKTQDANDLVPQVKKLMGPFGKVATVVQNQLYLQDMARNLRLIHQMLENIDQGAAKKK